MTSPFTEENSLFVDPDLVLLGDEGWGKSAQRRSTSENLAADMLTMASNGTTIFRLLTDPADGVFGRTDWMPIRLATVFDGLLGANGEPVDETLSRGLAYVPIKDTAVRSGLRYPVLDPMLQYIRPGSRFGSAQRMSTSRAKDYWAVNAIWVDGDCGVKTNGEARYTPTEGDHVILFASAYFFEPVIKTFRSMHRTGITLTDKSWKIEVSGKGKDKKMSAPDMVAKDLPTLHAIPIDLRSMFTDMRRSAEEQIEQIVGLGKWAAQPTVHDDDKSMTAFEQSLQPGADAGVDGDIDPFAAPPAPEKPSAPVSKYANTSLPVLRRLALGRGLDVSPRSNKTDIADLLTRNDAEIDSDVVSK